MPTLLKTAGSVRLYVRGHRNESRYFISELTPTTFRRLGVDDYVADALRAFSEPVFEHTARELLASGRASEVETYFECAREREPLC